MNSSLGSELILWHAVTILDVVIKRMWMINDIIQRKASSLCVGAWILEGSIRETGAFLSLGLRLCPSVPSCAIGSSVHSGMAV